MNDAVRSPGATAPVLGEGLVPAFIYWSYRTAAALAERLPLAVGDALARVGGLVAWRFARHKRAIVRNNLRRVLGDGPQLDRAVRAAFLAYARYWLETFRLGRYCKEDLLAMVECAEPERLRALLQSDGGVVIVSAHFGFYDVALAWLGVQGYRVTTVAQVLRPRALFEWFVSLRERFGEGIRVLPASPGHVARHALLNAVTDGATVVLLGDRDLGRHGVRVELFGEETSIPVGPAYLAVRTGAPLLAAAIYEKGPASSSPGRKRFVLEIEELAYERTGDETHDIAAVSRLLVRALERVVLKAPEQWHLFTTNWPADEPDLPPRQAQVDALERPTTADAPASSPS